jgi:hypothetical protein
MNGGMMNDESKYQANIGGVVFSGFYPTRDEAVRGAWGAYYAYPFLVEDESVYVARWVAGQLVEASA